MHGQKRERLKILKNENDNIIIIDLASSPGGVDFIKAKEYNIKTIQALGLPGKVAPVTSAKYIKNTLKKILNQERRNLYDNNTINYTRNSSRANRAFTNIKFSTFISYTMDI